MLEIKNIKKEYRTGDLVQRALDDVSLNLRDNEFVAILGPSGSGKTTLLNIIGGLDRYDSGDLIINGVSTKRYKDRDWDSYRNHTIGFVFQSYNLIPHQTLLGNVELALTISGISRKERRQRAQAALEQVGLGEQSHKHPNQLSGGQMQRVAIARALVNNPDILLADEPTGALDTVTSVQVMELLKEVAKDRLVVMVTHNPELAEEYANRIVRVKDGKILNDSNPFEPKNSTAAPVHKNLGKASMNFFTALGLSFNNLLTKKARTLLVSFAGSIGIIGIALILALSNGANKYIKDTEEQTLSEYPLQITSTSFSLSSMFRSTYEQMHNGEEGRVLEVSAVNNVFSIFGSNDLASLRDFFEDDRTVYDYARAVEYTYSLTPQIYSIDEENHSYRQVNPNNDFEAIGLGGDSMMMSMSGSSMNIFYELPSDPSLYESQYEVMAGRWPDNTNEAVLVLTSNSAVTDFTVYTFNLRDHQVLEDMINDFASGETVDAEGYSEIWDYDDFMGYSFKVLGAYEPYTYDESRDIYINRNNDSDFMYDLVDSGRDLTIVGIVRPSPDADIYMLSDGIYYHSDLVEELLYEALEAPVVQAQLNSDDINVLTGERFDAENSNFSMEDMFTIDEEAFANAFSFDDGSMGDGEGFDLDLDLSGIDYSSAFNGIDIPSMTPEEFANVMSSLRFEVDSEAMMAMNTEIITGYMEYAASNPATNYEGLQAGIDQYMSSPEGEAAMTAAVATLTAQGITDPNLILAAVMAGYSDYASANGLPNPAAFNDSFEAYMDLPETQQMIADNMANVVNMDEVQAQVAEAMRPYTNRLSASIERAMTNMMSTIGDVIAEQVEEAIEDAFANMGDSMSFDGDAFADAFQFNMDESEMQAMFMQMMNSAPTSASTNLSSFGYVDPDDIFSITIYPNDFESKAFITDLIDSYNESVDEDHKIAYTDIVGTLMSSVTDIVDAISYVLVAFVSISLVVSSIMIGVITYISVLERRKEIGILRAMGASKNNISQVFNAETFITGFLAGFLGVGVSLLLLIPANIIIRNVTDVSNLTAYLTVAECVALVALSVILTLIGGLIPSSKAAKQDPVTALRTE
ncbi:MAG: ABC transporter ATP-binding protein/permease [Saccharofermentans sp.]|nr:ABC transporter ATP-binding protein/permease [Saccharofermentans sp.]